MAIGPRDEEEVREAVQSFYDAFNAHDFDGVEGFTTVDWSHIDPFGRLTRGRAKVLMELKEVHGSFLRGVTDTVEEISVSFVTSDVALVTVASRVGTFTTPDGVKHENQRPLRTFVVVRRDGSWKIVHDQNTLRRG